MKKFFVLSGVCAVALMSNIDLATADVSVWQDADTRMTVSYRDTWRQIHNQYLGDVLTVRAPGANDFAECVVNIQDDGRYAIYPVGLSRAVQRQYFSVDHWNGYLARYTNPVIRHGFDNEGLGDGAASMMKATYETNTATKMQKTSLGFVSHYQNNVYTVECSAEQSAYPRWENAFLSFIKSTDFYNRTNFAYSGYYRDFIHDKTLKVRGPNRFYDTYLGVHTP